VGWQQHVRCLRGNRNGKHRHGGQSAGDQTAFHLVPPVFEDVRLLDRTAHALARTIPSSRSVAETLCKLN